MAPLAVSFAGSAQGGVSPYSYQWSFGDGQISSLQSPAHSYANPGTYIAVLTITDNSGAHGSSSVSVAVSAAILPLVASAVSSLISDTAPLAVSFAGSAQGGVSPYSYRWNFGDGQISSLQSPAHNYANPGTYIAVLTVTDSLGNTASKSVAITARSVQTDKSLSLKRPKRARRPIR
jgi:PKD repeat protein